MDLINDFQQYLHLNLPVWYIIAIFVCLSVAVIFPFVKRSPYRIAKRVIIGGVLLAYILLLYGSTIFFRQQVGDFKWELMPFWKYPLILTDDSKRCLISEICMNIGIYIPIGMLLSAYMDRRTIGKVLLCGCGFSALNELLQLITKTGLCETDDVVNNAVGTLIGIGVFVVVKGVFRNVVRTRRELDG